MFARAAGLLVLLSIGLVALLPFSQVTAAAGDRAAPIHHCGKLHTYGFPGVSALRAQGTSCKEARGVARWIYRELHRASYNDESFGLPAKVGPVDGRTFRCHYREVSDSNGFIYYATRCRSGHSVAWLHLSS